MPKANRKLPRPDPILATIENHRQAWIKSQTASRAEAILDNRIVYRKSNPRPRDYVHLRGYTCSTNADIDDARRKLLAVKLKPSTINAEAKAAKAELAKQKRAFDRWETRTGLKKLRIARQETGRIEEAAARKLASVRGTTLAGVLALLDYIDAFNRGEMGISKKGWHSEALLWPEEYRTGVRNVGGHDMKQHFAFWLLLNVRQSLEALREGGR